MTLTTSVTEATTGHATLHNDANTQINHLIDGTGSRNMASLLINGWTATSVYLERQGNRVFFRFRGLNGTAASNSRIMEVPSGFQPPAVMESGSYRSSTSTWTLYLTVSLSGGITMATGAQLGTTTDREFSWPCVVAWPTTLPGIAA